MNHEFFKIETAIPIPPQGGGRPKCELRLAMEKLQVNESVLIPRDLRQPDGIHRLAKMVGIRVTQRQVNGEARRIWRVE